MPAPTTSTTTALALGDALAIAVARRLHSSPADAFHTYHPGGAIGAAVQKPGRRRMADIAIPVADVPIAGQSSSSPSSSSSSSSSTSPFSVGTVVSAASLTALDILLTAARSPSGWVRLSSSVIIAPRRIQALAPHLDRPVHALDPGTVVHRDDWISFPAASTVVEAREWIGEMRESERGRTFLKEGTVLGVVDADGEVSGVVEIEELVGFGD